MKVVIVSHDNNSKINTKNNGEMHIIKDLQEGFFDIDAVNKNIKHITIDDGGDLHHLGLPIKKESILPTTDLLIDISHHHYDEHYYYAHRLGVKILFKKNIDRLSIRSILDQMGEKVGEHLYIKKDYDKQALIKRLFLPSVVKSVNYKVPTFIGQTHKDIIDYIDDNMHKDNFIIENYLKHQFCTCVFIKSFRDKDIYNTFIFDRVKKESGFEYIPVRDLPQDIESDIYKIGEKVLNAMDANIVEINFAIKTDNENKTKTFHINSCIFSPRYFPGTAFYEILKYHGINIFLLAHNFAEK